MKLILLLFISTLIFADCLDDPIPTTQESVSETLRCFQDEIKSLKESSQTIEVKAIEGLPLPTVSKSGFAGNFRYDLHECKRTGTTLKCTLTITNTSDKDIMNGLFQGKVYDENGNIVNIRSNFIAGQKSVMARDFIAKVPVNAYFVVNDIPPSSTQLTAIKLNTSFGELVLKGIVIQ